MTFSTENNKQIVLGEELGPLSDNERLKKQSNLLRGTIAEDFARPNHWRLYSG